MSPPRISVLLPARNAANTIELAVRSVLAQTSDDWILTVVDDAYPDESVAEYFAAIDDPRITYLRNDENVGITQNYRRCVELATQDLVVLLGCDDLLLPRYVEVVLEAHRQFPEVAVIQPGVQVVDENGTVVRTLVDVVKQRVTMPRGRGRRVVRGERLAASLLEACDDGNTIHAPRAMMLRPVAPEAVARKLAALALAAPQGRARDVAGPEDLRIADLAWRWIAITGKRRSVIEVDGAPARWAMLEKLTHGDAERIGPAFADWLQGHADAR